MKKRWKQAAAAAAMLAAFGSWTEESAAAQPIGSVTVTTPWLNVRADDAFSARVIKTVKKGTELSVYETSNGLYAIGKNQWISASRKYVKFQPAAEKETEAEKKPAAAYIEIKAAALNIRTKASFSAPLAGMAKKGQQYAVLEEKNGLYRIGENQWVSAKSQYVSKKESGVQRESVAESVPVERADDTAAAMIAFAKQFVGMPYKWGASHPKTGGFDCSGYMYYVMKEHGAAISRLNVEGYWKQAEKIQAPQAGDLVFYQNTYKKGPSHMGIYLGDGTFLHASSSKGVGISSLTQPYYQKRFLGYGRLR